MSLVFIGIWIFMFVLSLSAIAALIWAIKSNQFHDFQKGAQSIFDEEEPIGEITDKFPDQEQHDK